MKKIAYYLLILFFIASCRSYQPLSDLESGIVNGTVLDKTTNSGIPNATVYLLGNEGGGTWGGGGTASFLLDQTTSDAAGNFDFSFDYNNDYGYYCSAVAAQYFNYNEEIPVGDATFGANNVELELQPISYLELHIKNVNPFNNYDELTLSYTYNGSYPELIGNEVDTTICCFQLLGNESNRVVWYVEKNGEGTSYFEYVVTPAFDTTYYEILY